MVVRKVYRGYSGFRSGRYHKHSPLQLERYVYLIYASVYSIHDITHDFIYQIQYPTAVMSLRLSSYSWGTSGVALGDYFPNYYCPLAFVVDRNPPSEFWCAGVYTERTKSWIRLIKFMLFTGHHTRFNNGIHSTTHPVVTCLILKYGLGNDYTRGVKAVSMLNAAVNLRTKVIRVMNTLGHVTRDQLIVSSRRNLNVRLQHESLALLHTYSFQRLLRHRFSVCTVI